METLPTTSYLHLFPPKFMPPLFPANFPLPLLLRRLAPVTFRVRSTSSATTTAADEIIITAAEPSTSTAPNGRKNPTNNRTNSKDAEKMKLKWLDSLSCPDCYKNRVVNDPDYGSRWVIGVDPDVSGALAVLKPDDSVEVFDAPHLEVLIGKRVRKRLDAKSIIQLLQNVDAPMGTTVYIEQSIPYPQDGKQGWWSSGFGYGLWIGILVASGYSVIPVPSLLWKNEFKLAGSRSSKDDSRELASTLFPSINSLLKRKKDHGRAEALLIAAYGKGLKADFGSLCSSSDLVPQKQDNFQEPAMNVL